MQVTHLSTLSNNDYNRACNLNKTTDKPLRQNEHNFKYLLKRTQSYRLDCDESNYVL